MTCRIVLDNPGSYHPGDSVYGRVVVNFNSKENFRAIKCRFRGKEHTAWTERESYYDSSSKSTKYRTVHYSGDNTFIYVNLILVGEGSLHAGHYEYPFSFTFPTRNLPNPYHGNYGYIRYYIKANVDKSFAFDYEDEITLSLLSPINFNDIRNELQLNPVGLKDEKILCCMCCASEPITMDLILEKEAFVLGEVAKIKVEISNMSNETITELILKLKMTIESKTTSPRTHHKYDTELVGFLSDTGVGAHGQRVYNLDFVIPARTVLPNFQGSTLFKQWCVLKAEAVIPGCHTNLEIETGVKLGHIPILGGPSFGGATYVPASQCPGGAFPPPPPPSNVSPPPYPPEEKAPPYPLEDKAPPYPMGPPSFPLPNGNEAGFVDGATIPLLPGKGMPMPSVGQGGPSSSAASAPQEDGAPSAPSKAKMAEQEGFEIVDDEGNDEPPPPSYQDFVKGTGSDPTAPSAPPK